MKYGYFDDANREYVITTPKTPVKWINYVGTMRFGGIVDHTGGTLLCKDDPALNRIVKYIPQLPSSDFKGETLYLRFKENGRYRVFSPYFVPTLDSYDRYECHVGLGGLPHRGRRQVHRRRHDAHFRLNVPLTSNVTPC